MCNQCNPWPNFFPLRLILAFRGQLFNNFTRMKFLSVLICAILLSSCEKNINFKLKVVPDVLVVDASIENNQPPIIVLSKSFAYFSNITPEALDTSFVHGATVSVSNGTQTQQLKEYSIDSTGGYFIYYYSIDTSNLSCGIYRPVEYKLLFKGTGSRK